MTSTARPDGPDANETPAATLSTRKLALWALAIAVLCEVFFVWADYALNYGRGARYGPLRRFFNIAREDGVASWFAVMQTMMVALTLFLLHAIHRARASATRVQRWGWLVLAIFFTYLSFDDGTEFHERIGSVWGMIQQDALSNQGDPPALVRWARHFPSYHWQLVFLPFFAAMGMFMFWFLWREFDTRWQRLALTAAFSLLAFALGLDFIEGLDPVHEWNVYAAWGQHPGVESFTQSRFNREGYEAIRHFSKSLEEFAEMLAMTLLWVGLIARLGQTAPGPLTFRVTH